MISFFRRSKRSPFSEGKCGPSRPLGLEAQGLCWSRGKREILKGVSLTLGPGELLGLIGPNGAGKTSCFRLLAGLDAPDSGSLWLDGEDVTCLPLHLRARRGLTWLPQEPSIFVGESALDNLRIALELIHFPGNITEEAQRLLERLGLTGVAATRAELLSGGERRRLELARALSMKPRFLLLDEPFTGLDPKAVLELVGIVRGIVEAGVAVLLTDHHVLETLRLCPRVVLLYEGRVLAEGTPEALMAQETVRQVYLGPVVEWLRPQ